MSNGRTHPDQQRHGPSTPGETLRPASADVAAEMRARPPHRAPESIGPYRLLEVIGEGGMGVVYRAEQREPVRRLVALKVIKLGMDTKEVVARFEAERQALALMNHPNVAKVFDAGVTEQGRPYFAMEFVAGVPLTQYCDEAKLTTAQRLELFVQVCHAVQHAHQKGIIHRDLKPSNILVAMFDGQPVPKVIDFGIAKATNSALTTHTLYTRAGSLVGTPEYMSPEQAGTSGLDVDTRTDVYSLGVILYELLTGTLPFDPETLRKAGPEGFARILRESEPAKPSTRLGEQGRTHQAAAAASSGNLGAAPGATDAGDGPMIAAVARRHRTDARSLLREVRGDLDWIVLKAIEKDRTRRYETANGMAMDVERHLHHEPVLARPPSTAYRLRKLARKHRAAVLTTVLVAAALVAAVVGTGVGLVRARAAQHRAETAEGRANAESEAAKAARAAAERDARRALAANEFMRNMFAAARPQGGAGGAASGAGDQVKVVDVLEHAAQGLGGLGDDQPELELDGRLTLGHTYASLGLMDKALPHYNRALDLSRRLWGPESEQALQVTADVTFAMGRSGSGAQAEPMARQAADAARRVLGKHHPVTLDVVNSLGLSLLNAEKYAESEAVLRGLVKHVREHGPVPGPKGSSRFFNNLALALGAQGRNAEAEQVQRDGIAFARGEPTPDANRTAALLINLAVNLQRQGRLAEAEAAHEDAVAHDRRTLGATHPNTLAALDGLAALHEQRANFAKALAARRELFELVKSSGNEFEAFDHRFLLAELMARAGDEDGAREAFAALLPDVRALRDRHAADRPDLANLARQWWATANAYTGLRYHRAWSGRAVQGFASHAIWAMLVRRAHGDPALDEPDWAGLRFRVDAWPPPPPPPPPQASDTLAPATALSGPAVIEGGLAELWSTADPPPGVYLFSVALPRRNGRRPMREGMWIYLTPWTVSYQPLPPNFQNLGEGDWNAVFTGEPRERRSEPALAFDQFGQVSRGFGPAGVRRGFALSATTQAKLPAGDYHLRVFTEAPVRVYIDEGKVLDAWTTSNDSADINAPPDDPGNRLKVVAGASADRLVVTVQPRAPAAVRMMALARGTTDFEAEADQYSESLARPGGDLFETRRARAMALVRSGLLDEAAADYARAIELNPDDHQSRYECACVLAWLQRGEAYQRVCREMVEHFGDATKPEIAERTAKACMLLPGLADDDATMTKLVGRALAAGEGTGHMPYFEMAKGLAELRGGRHATALTWLERAGSGVDKLVPTVAATDDFLRGLVLLKLGRTDEARAAVRSGENRLRDAGVGATPGIDDFGWSLIENFLICDVLHREATAAVSSGGSVGEKSK